MSLDRQSEVGICLCQSEDWNHVVEPIRKLGSHLDAALTSWLSVFVWRVQMEYVFVTRV